MAMTLALFQVSLVQSLWLIEGLSGLLLKPLLADACSYPDWLACECLRDHSFASENNYRFKKRGRCEAENVTSSRVWKRGDIFEFFIQLHCQSLTSYCQHFQGVFMHA